MDPCFETATRLARAIRNGRLSAVEATEAHLQRIARLNGSLNALVVVDGERALKAARAADRARGRKAGKLGALHGVPITIKEAFDVEGLATTSSHPPLKDNLAHEDASLVGRLRAAGAVILGKTNVPELCADFQTDSPLLAPPRTPGISGGRLAAELAAALCRGGSTVTAGAGSDIGGSVRNPAHYNGILAEATEWRVPGRGHVRPRADAHHAHGVSARCALGRPRNGAAHHCRSRRLRRGSRARSAGSTPVLKPRSGRARIHRQGVGRYGCGQALAGC